VIVATYCSFYEIVLDLS